MSTIPISQVRKRLAQLIKPLFTSAFVKIYEATVKEVNETDVPEIILAQSAEIERLLTEMIAASNVFDLNNIYSSHDRLTIFALYLRYYYCINFMTSAKQDKRLVVPDDDQQFLHFMLFEYMESEAIASSGGR